MWGAVSRLIRLTEKKTFYRLITVEEEGNIIQPWQQQNNSENEKQSSAYSTWAAIEINEGPQSCRCHSSFVRPQGIIKNS
jgi:hypothetical protein